MIAQSMPESSSRKRNRNGSSSNGEEPESQEDDGTTDWKASHQEVLQSLQEETRKNTELHLQLMFVRSECVRLMGVQDVMNKSITKLQDSLNDWMTAVTSDDDEEEGEEDDNDDVNDEDPANDHHETTNGEDQSGNDSEDNSTDGEDMTSKRRRKLINVVGNKSR